MKKCKATGMDVSYFYFGRTPKNKHRGVITVAYIVDGDGNMKLAFSFCSPSDRFEKDKGRDLACRRLFYGKTRHKPTGTHVKAAYITSYGECALDTVIDFFNQNKDMLRMPFWARDIVLQKASDYEQEKVIE